MSKIPRNIPRIRQRTSYSSDSTSNSSFSDSLTNVVLSGIGVRVIKMWYILNKNRLDLLVGVSLQWYLITLEDQWKHLEIQWMIQLHHQNIHG